MRDDKPNLHFRQIMTNFAACAAYRALLPVNSQYNHGDASPASSVCDGRRLQDSNLFGYKARHISKSASRVY